MTEQPTFDGLAPEVRDVRDRFARLVEPHRPALWAYCLRLTGSPWEAEDLSQETLMKAFARLANLWQPMEIKPYLFRIASNAWIDMLRKARVQIDPLDDAVDDVHAAQSPSAIETEEAMAAMLRRLPPRQRVICLLIETLGFSADDVAGMLGATRGAVKAALHRARTTLAASEGKLSSAAPSNRALSTEERGVLERYIDAFNRRDAEAIAALLDERASTDIVGLAEEHGRDVIRKQSLAGTIRDPTPEVAELGFLAGEPVVFIFAIGEGGERRLRWMVRPEIVNGRIVRQRDYFFTPELIGYAAAQMNVPAVPFGYYFSSDVTSTDTEAGGYE